MFSFYLFGIVILNILDLATTKIALSLGAIEVNPVMNSIVNTDLFILIKIIVPILVAIHLYRRSKVDLKRVLLCSKITFYIYLTVVVLNIITLIRMR